MKADILTLKSLFQKDVRYLIPTFQRPYVWNQDEQWEPLWNDVRNIAESYLEELERLGPDKQAAAEEGAGTHFMGAVVLQQQATATADLETRHVIDGQQRLLTLQLLLDAAQEVFEQDGLTREGRLLRKAVLNDEDLTGSDPDNSFKIWPTLVDREAFRRAMSNDLDVDGLDDAAIVQAHQFFRLQIREWLAQASGREGDWAEGLVTALLGLLEVVVIDLQPLDNANLIFETLNARGTPLLASDLIKNSVLHDAHQAGLDSDALYESHWKSFDETWWRDEVRQGRLTRPRIDVYLNYWLIMRTAKEVLSSDVFPKFREYVSNVGQGISSVVADIDEISSAYRLLESLDDFSPEGAFVYRFKVMDAGVSTPVVMWLFSNRSRTGESAFLEALGAIESYLVRRMICRMSTKEYSRLFLDLIGEIGGTEPNKVGRAVSAFLASHTQDTRIWPTDSQVTEALLNLPLYQLLTRGRLRLILEALEDSLRSEKSEEAHVQRGLTIEHAMPQAWREHWPLDEPTDEERAMERDRTVHTIGNLTLLNSRLNPALSNSDWSTKRPELAKHSVLHLNKQLLEAGHEVWNEDLIRERGVDLAATVVRIWSRPG